MKNAASAALVVLMAAFALWAVVVTVRDQLARRLDAHIPARICVEERAAQSGMFMGGQWIPTYSMECVRYEDEE